MEFTFQYTKTRRLFGKQCVFSSDSSKLYEDLKPDKSFTEKYIVKNPICKGVQVGYTYSENVANTHIKDYNDRGMNHVEGGWPKEVDVNDEEAVLRYRKKTERLDNYIAAMQRLTKPMEHAILQNNAINIYERYFEENASSAQNTVETVRIQSKFKDPNKPPRPITSCSWAPDGTQFCISYGTTMFQSPLSAAFDAYIWDLERPLAPEMAVLAETPILSLEYNARDAQWLAAGLYTGQVAYFDIRRGPNPMAVSPLEESHRDPAHSVLWINSKSGAEFFSTSSDGVVMWWDCRRLDKPIDSIILDATKGDKPNINRAYQACCLEYEPSIPARYMVGSETGYVIFGNRKGTNHAEKLPVVQKSQTGPIYSIHRNQGFSKNFMVVGAWSAKIWSEDCKESAIIWTKNYSKRLTAGQWSMGRFSLFFLTREDGYLDIWDLLIDQESPIMSMKLSEEPLTTLRGTDDGLLVLTGNAAGTAFVVRLPSNYAESLKNEKVFLSSMFDRESRREKLLEGRNREIKLKQREMMLAKEAREARELAKELGGGETMKTELEIQTEKYRNALETDYLAEVENGAKELERKRDAWKRRDPAEEGGH